jgi:hypothetical protein
MALRVCADFTEAKSGEEIELKGFSLFIRLSPEQLRLIGSAVGTVIAKKSVDTMTRDEASVESLGRAPVTENSHTQLVLSRIAQVEVIADALMRHATNPDTDANLSIADAASAFLLASELQSDIAEFPRDTWGM